MHTLTVEGKDGRKFEFRGDLAGMARLIGPQGGRYEFSAALLRAFLREWAAGIDGEEGIVSASDNRRFHFPADLVGTARLIGPDGGAYEFDSDLFREFLKRWARDSVFQSSLGK
jgi:hypothetical protein